MIEMVRRYLRQKFGSAGVIVALAMLAILEILHLASGGPPIGASTRELGDLRARRGLGFARRVERRPADDPVPPDPPYANISSDATSASSPHTRLPRLHRLLALLACHRRSGGGGIRLSIPRLVALAAVGAFFTGALQAAILLFFSTFLPGIADLLGLLMLYLVLNLPPWKAEWLREAARLGRENLTPIIPWNEVLRGNAVLGAATGRWVFALCLYLTLAVLIFCRRELPYGQD